MGMANHRPPTTDNSVMKLERWQKIEELYHEACARKPEERPAFLDAACQGDKALRGELESLLALASRAENFIEAPALEVAASLLAEPSTALAAGQSLAHYKLLAFIGAGGMGEVYAALDTRLGRKIALKLLPKQFTQDGDRLRRFEQEARAASALNHPNILIIHDIGQSAQTHYLATEFIEGETLRQRLLSGRLEVAETLEIGCQIAGALASAHRAGIIHRDIKPENLMLRPDGYVKVLDFGLAKLLETDIAPTGATRAELSTNPGMIMGTVRYMSPEQLRGQRVDARSDLFSLGVVLYEMITGGAPFAGETTADVIAAIVGKEPPPVSAAQPNVPKALEALVTKALRKARDERYQSAEELFADLKALKQVTEFAALQRALESEQQGVAPSQDIAPAAEAQTTSVIGSASGVRSRRVIDSLAILPLANTVDDPEMEYFSDGVTESLIHTLSRLPELQVMAWSAVSRYKNQQLDPRDIGQRLGVRAVLTGRVTEMGEQLVISMELVDAQDGSHLWGERYRCKASAILDLETDISRELSEKLLLRLTSDERRRLTKRHTKDVEAYHAYLKGRYFWNKRTVESLNRGVEYFKQAIDLDPSYAAAYAGLSDSFTLLCVREALLPQEGFARAKAAAEMALQIDEQLAEAHASLGHAMLHNWEWQEGETALKKAIALNPGYASAHHWYSEHLTAMGRCEESISELKLAAELDPLSLVINADLGRAYYYARQYDEVMKQEARTLEMDANFWLSHINIGRSLTQKGMHQKAIQALENARAHSQGNTEVVAFLGFAYATAGQKDKALEALDELDHLGRSSYVPAYHFAIVYAGLSDNDRAFEWLERAYDRHAVDLFTLKVEPMFDALRAEGRFADLLRRVGLLSSDSQAVTVNSASRAAPKTIAVLPFKPINRQERDEYLELGMADALINRLGNLAEVVVRPTSAVRRYLDVEADTLEAGRELKAESVIEGNIQRLGDKIRVTCRLLRVEDGRSLWADKFDEPFTDIFSVQDSISERVAASLALRLSSEERARLTKRYTDNAEAYHLYLKGRFYWNKRAQEAMRQSLDYFQQAIEIDPNYALAYAGLADSYTFLGDVAVTAISPKEAFAKGRAAAVKALELDEQLAEAHASLGHLYMHHFEWAAAEKEFCRAIELKPNYAVAHQWYAYYLIFNARPEEALAEITRALELDPLSQPVQADMAEILYYTRHYDEAIEQFHRALDMNPQYYHVRMHLARVYEQKHRFEEAIAELEKALSASNRSPAVVASLARTLARVGRNDEAARLLAELQELAQRHYVSPYDLALIYAELGDLSQAFVWLEKAYEERSEWMIYLTVDPRLDSLRRDRRFQDLTTRVGLPDDKAIS
jgi:serine/threonine-protein kinase